MSCALHTTRNGLGYSMNSSGNYSSFAPACTCSPAWRAAVEAAEAAGIPVRRTDTAADQLPFAMPSRSTTNMPPARSATSYGPGTGAGAGLAAAGGGLPAPTTVPSLLATRTNGGGIQPGDLDGIAAPAPTLTRSMTGAYEAGFSNFVTPTLFRESRFSAHSASTEGEEADGGAAPAAPSVRRSGTEWGGPPTRDLESLKEETRSNLRQLLYALQSEIERPQIFRSHDEMAIHDQRFAELDEQIEAILRLLTALN